MSRRSIAFQYLPPRSARSPIKLSIPSKAGNNARWTRIIHLSGWMPFTTKSGPRATTKAERCIPAGLKLNRPQGGSGGITLGLYLADSEGANFWLGVLSDLQNRGIQDILIASVDGLTGFPDAIQAIFPKTEVAALHARGYRSNSSPGHTSTASLTRFRL